MRVLVTGARGSIGSALVSRLEGAGDAEVFPVDKEDADIQFAPDVSDVFDEVEPDLVYHLAGAKSAPEGELDPTYQLMANGIGTANVLMAAGTAKVITASSCKACDPETVYGASKLLAERMTLQAGGSVARFYNVRESCGNVHELWASLPEDTPIPVTPCWRYFISMDQAVNLLLQLPHLPPGRYTVDPGNSRPMSEWAHMAYPGRAQVQIGPRRGDRLYEPRCAQNEEIRPKLPFGIERILNTHDVPQPVAA